MSEFEDMVRDFSNVVLNENQRIGETVTASTKHLVESAQMRSSEDLHRFLEQYEQNQKEQAKENCLNRRISVASLVIAAISMVIAIVK